VEWERVSSAIQNDKCWLGLKEVCMEFYFGACPPKHNQTIAQVISAQKMSGQKFQKLD
jgi:phosphatidylethanolamine-binding protein (PEBP) family uncharacterized protein